MRCLLHDGDLRVTEVINGDEANGGPLEGAHPHIVSHTRHSSPRPLPPTREREQDHLRDRWRRLRSAHDQRARPPRSQPSRRSSRPVGPNHESRWGASSRLSGSHRDVRRPQAGQPHKSRCGGFAVDLRLVAVDLRWIVHQTAPNTGKRVLPNPSVLGLFSCCSVGFGETKTIGAPGFEPGTSPTRKMGCNRTVSRKNPANHGFLRSA